VERKTAMTHLRYGRQYCPRPVDRWDVTWRHHNPEIDIYSEDGRTFMVRAVVTPENAAHVREVIDLIGRISCIPGRTEAADRQPSVSSEGSSRGGLSLGERSAGQSLPESPADTSDRRDRPSSAA
jgi:hypothetical protein